MRSTYILTGAGLLIGAYIGFFVLDFEPAFVGWMFGIGGGLTTGAFIAALATNTPLVGRGDQRTHRGVVVRPEDYEGVPRSLEEELEDYENEDGEDIPSPPSRNGHGTSGSH